MPADERHIISHCASTCAHDTIFRQPLAGIIIPPYIYRFSTPREGAASIISRRRRYSPMQSRHTPLPLMAFQLTPPRAPVSNCFTYAAIALYIRLRPSLRRCMTSSNWPLRLPFGISRIKDRLTALFIRCSLPIRLRHLSRRRARLQPLLDNTADDTSDAEF